MIHKSSIAAQEVSIRGIIEQASSASVRRSRMRLEYNSAEFREAIRHQSVQTDIHRDSLDGHDISLQVDLTSEEFQKLRVDLERKVSEYDTERTKCADREMLLVSQMNAIRDQQAIAKAEEDASVQVAIVMKRVVIAESFIPSGYDQIWIVLSGIEAEKSEQCIRITSSEVGEMSPSEVRVSQVPMTMRVPRLCGQFILTASIHMGTRDGNKYELILGECSFPSFIPCMRERGRSESHKLPLGSCGYIEAELVFT